MKKIMTFLLLCTTLPQATMAKPTTSQSCPEKGIYLQVLGAGGPELDDAHQASTGYALWDNGKIRLLVDTGTGTARRFGQTGQSFNDVEIILYSHFHTDHSADFAAYVKNSFFTQRQNNLFIYGPTGNLLLPGAHDFVKRFIGKNGVFPYLSSFLTGNGRYQVITTDIKPSAKAWTLRKNGMVLSAVEAQHGPFLSLAWRVNIKGKTVTFSGDNSAKTDYLDKLAKNSDLLVAHNAVPESIAGVAKNLHMTPSRIGEIAAQAHPKHLLLSHLMKRTDNKHQETRAGIRAHYAGKITFAKSMACIQI